MLEKRGAKIWAKPRPIYRSVDRKVFWRPGASSRGPVLVVAYYEIVLSVHAGPAGI